MISTSPYKVLLQIFHQIFSGRKEEIKKKIVPRTNKPYNPDNTQNTILFPTSLASVSFIFLIKLLHKFDNVIFIFSIIIPFAFEDFITVFLSESCTHINDFFFSVLDFLRNPMVE